MSNQDKPNPEDRAASRDARIIAHRLELQERYVALLRLAKRAREVVSASAAEIAELTDLIKKGDDQVQVLYGRAGGRILPRGRPKGKDHRPASSCTIYLDECGSHAITAKDPFGVFVLAGVIIPDSEYPEIDDRWKAWKQACLGSADKIVHEPDVRGGKGPFWADGNPVRRGQVLASLRQILAQLEFSGIVCVIHREDYRTEIGTPQLDESLPTHHYLMTLDFLAERAVMALEDHFDSARGHVVAESRGPKEDAELQYEFARLHLDGTAYVPPTWFRQQLTPDISFVSKKDNNTGLQLADLLARPCGEKVLDPSSTPDRWPELRSKLCVGQRTAHSILGIKILPWRDAYLEIWNS